MPKKPSNNRLDRLFEDIKEEAALPSRKSSKKKATGALKEVKPRPAKSAPAVQSLPASTSKAHPLARTAVLPSLEPATVLQPGSAQAPASMSLAFQTGDKNWATLQVIDEADRRRWGTNEQLLVRQVADQLSLALENAHLFQETRARAEELAVLNELAQRLAARLDVDQVMQEIYRGLGRLMDVRNFYIGLYNPEKNEVVFPLNVSESVVDQNITVIRADQGITGHIIRTRAPFLVKENLAAELAKIGIEPVGDMAESWLGVPLMQGDEVLGVMGVQSYSESHHYDEHDRDLMLAFAGQAAIAIQNARLFQEAQHRAEIARLTSDISASFVGVDPLKVDAAIQAALQRLGEFTGVDRAYLFLFNPDGNTMDNTHEWCAEGITSHINDLKKIPVETFPYLMESLRRFENFYVSRVVELPKEASAEKREFERESIKSIVCAPLGARDNLIGFIGFDAVQNERVWSEDELNLLGLVGSLFVTALNQKQTAEALRKSEADLRSLFASMEDVVLVYDKDGRYVRIAPTNPARLIRPPDELLGKLVDEVLPAQTAAYFKDAIRRTLATGETVQIEYELPVENQKYWFLANLTKLDDDHVFWVARDITERKKAEEELTKFKLGIESSSDAVFITSTDGTILYANPAFEKVYGYNPEEVIGKNPRIIKPGLVPQEQYKYFWDTLLSKRTVTGEIINKSKDGRLVPIAETNSPITDAQGNLLGFLAVHHDITERKQAEEALQRRNTYLAASAEIGRLVTSTLDLNTLFSRTVNLVRERFGFYHAAIFIVEETGFNAVLQEATGEAGAQMKAQKHSLAVGSKSVVGEVTNSGKAVVVNDTATSAIHKKNPLLPDTRAEAGIPLRIGNRIIGALDIQSKDANAFKEDDVAVLQTLADQIAIAIDNARSYELSLQAVKEMREIDRLKSQFLANMSHELRTPLNSIIGFSRVILKGIDGPITDLQQQDLLAIHNSGQHLLGLINDILDLSRIEAGKMELSFDEVNMRDLINSVMSTITGLIKDRPIKLERHIPDNLPTVRADTMRVRQVLINLLSNAAKFTDEGTVSVKAEVQQGPAGHPELLVSVTDTGSGIAPEDQGKLFQPFSQVDASSTRKTGGSGLGLSISHQLIQMHGGRIGVQSTPGQGSTFYFTLPLYRGKEDTSTLQASKVILAVDDDPQVIGLYERYLQPQGYQVIALSDPSKARERAAQLKPFAITLDIMMPGYDGWRVLQDLKSDSETRDIPVVICSIVEEREKGFSLGAADYLIKPILEDDLLNALDRLNADGSIREVLIIDDDPNDLRLIEKILKQAGRYKPRLAEGGRVGWEAITSRTPHAVILDLFMPEMDGFIILEKMRSRVKLRDIPVIVMTSGELSPEQQEQLKKFGQRLIQKSALNEQDLLGTLERTLKRVGA